MKSILYIYVLILLSGCGLLKDRSVDKSNEKFKFFDRSVIETTSPGDVIVLPAPRTPNERPRDTVITYTGERGATATTAYDKEGFLAGQIINCPDEQETKRMNIEGEYELRLKQVEARLNSEIVRETKSALIWIAAIFAAAWVLRGIFQKAPAS